MYGYVKRSLYTDKEGLFSYMKGTNLFNLKIIIRANDIVNNVGLFIAIVYRMQKKNSLSKEAWFPPAISRFKDTCLVYMDIQSHYKSPTLQIRRD